MAQSTDRAESTTAEGRALLRDRSYHAAGLIICPRWSNVSDEDAPCECDLPYAVTHIEAAAAEAERARVRAALRTAIRQTGWQCDADEHAGAVHDKQQCYCEKFADALERRLLRVLAAIDATPERTDLPLPFTYVGQRHLTFDNGRGEDYSAIEVEHPSGRWDRILIARDDGTLARAICAALATSDRADSAKDGEKG